MNVKRDHPPPSSILPSVHFKAATKGKHSSEESPINKFDPVGYRTIVAATYKMAAAKRTYVCENGTPFFTNADSLVDHLQEMWKVDR